MNRQISFITISILLLTGIIFTSCSRESFSSRKYQNLDYVKVKPSEQKELPPSARPTRPAQTDIAALTAVSTYPSGNPGPDKVQVIPDNLPLASSKNDAASIKKNPDISKQSKGDKELQKVESWKNLSKSQLKKLNAAPAGELSGLDSNLKLAIIFGAVGVVLLILGIVSYVFAIIGGISLVIGLVFLLIYLLQ